MLHTSNTSATDSHEWAASSECPQLSIAVKDHSIHESHTPEEETEEAVTHITVRGKGQPLLLFVCLIHFLIATQELYLCPNYTLSRGSGALL